MVYVNFLDCGHSPENLILLKVVNKDGKEEMKIVCRKCIENDKTILGDDISNIIGGKEFMPKSHQFLNNVPFDIEKINIDENNKDDNKDDNKNSTEISKNSE